MVRKEMAGATAIMSSYEQAQATANKDRQQGIEMYNKIGEFSAGMLVCKICLVTQAKFVPFLQFILRMDLTRRLFELKSRPSLNWALCLVAPAAPKVCSNVNLP